MASSYKTRKGRKNRSSTYWGAALNFLLLLSLTACTTLSRGQVTPGRAMLPETGGAQSSATASVAPVGNPGDLPTTGSRLLLPVMLSAYPTGARPYRADSFWNTPIGSNPTYDPNSSEMIATLNLDGEGQITSDPNQYSFPVYYADAATPRWDLPCQQYNCTVVKEDGITTTPILRNVPIPDGAKPSSGTDGQMIIIDRETSTEYDLYEAAYDSSSGWTVSNASTYNIRWDGTPTRYGSRGAGIPYLAGLIQPWEIANGQIEHAIAFAYPETANHLCVYPATKTDGKSSLPYAIPEGARLQLDPNLSEADFDQMGLSPTGKIIARALQKYGMVLVDTSGRPKIYAENLADNPFSSVQWTDPELNLTGSTIANIPVTAFRVIKLPDDIWNPNRQPPTYGDCYQSPLP